MPSSSIMLKGLSADDALHWESQVELDRQSDMRRSLERALDLNNSESDDNITNSNTMDASSTTSDYNSSSDKSDNSISLSSRGRQSHNHHHRGYISGSDDGSLSSSSSASTVSESTAASSRHLSLERTTPPLTNLNPHHSRSRSTSKSKNSHRRTKSAGRSNPSSTKFKPKTITLVSSAAELTRNPSAFVTPETKQAIPPPSTLPLPPPPSSSTNTATRPPLEIEFISEYNRPPTPPSNQTHPCSSNTDTFPQLNETTIQTLYQSLSQKTTQSNNLQLTLTHVTLQNNALQNNRTKLRRNLEALNYQKNEVVEQLQLCKQSNNRVNISELQGEMVMNAKREVFELRDLLSSARSKLDTTLVNSEDLAVRKDNEIKALKIEVQRLSGHLAQRSILFSSTERRLEMVLASSGRTENFLESKVTAANATVQGLEKRVEELDCKRENEAKVNYELSLKNHKLEIKINDCEVVNRDITKENVSLKSTNVSLRRELTELTNRNTDELDTDINFELDNLRLQSTRSSNQYNQKIAQFEIQDTKRKNEIQELRRVNQLSTNEVNKYKKSIKALGDELRLLESAGFGNANSTSLIELSRGFVGESFESNNADVDADVDANRKHGVSITAIINQIDAGFNDDVTEDNEATYTSVLSVSSKSFSRSNSSDNSSNLLGLDAIDTPSVSVGTQAQMVKRGVDFSSQTTLPVSNSNNTNIVHAEETKSLQNRNAYLNEGNNNLTNANERLEIELVNSNKLRVSLECHISKLEKSVQILQSESSESTTIQSTNFTASIDERKSYQQHITQLDQKVGALQSSRDCLHNESAVLLQDKKFLEEAKMSYVEENKLLVNRIHGLEKEIKSLSKALTTSKHQEVIVAELTKQRDEVNSRVTELEVQIKQKVASQQPLQQQYKALQTLLSTITSEKNALKIKVSEWEGIGAAWQAQQGVLMQGKKDIELECMKLTGELKNAKSSTSKSTVEVVKAVQTPCETVASTELAAPSSSRSNELKLESRVVELESIVSQQREVVESSKKDELNLSLTQQLSTLSILNEEKVEEAKNLLFRLDELQESSQVQARARKCLEGELEVSRIEKITVEEDISALEAKIEELIAEKANAVEKWTEKIAECELSSKEEQDFLNKALEELSSKMEAEADALMIEIAKLTESSKSNESTMQEKLAKLLLEKEADIAVLRKEIRDAEALNRTKALALSNEIETVTSRKDEEIATLMQQLVEAQDFVKAKEGTMKAVLSKTSSANEAMVASLKEEISEIKTSAKAKEVKMNGKLNASALEKKAELAVLQKEIVEIEMSAKAKEAMLVKKLDRAVSENEAAIVSLKKEFAETEALTSAKELKMADNLAKVLADTETSVAALNLEVSNLGALSKESEEKLAKRMRVVVKENLAEATSLRKEIAALAASAKNKSTEMTETFTRLARDKIELMKTHEIELKEIQSGLQHKIDDLLSLLSTSDTSVGSFGDEGSLKSSVVRLQVDVVKKDSELTLLNSRLNSFGVRNIDQLEAQGKQQAAFDDMDKQLGVRNAQFANSETKISSLNSKLKMTEGELEVHLTTMKSMSGEIVGKSSETASLVARVSVLAAEAAAKNLEVKVFESEIEELQTQLKTSRSRNSSVTEEAQVAATMRLERDVARVELINVRAEFDKESNLAAKALSSAREACEEAIAAASDGAAAEIANLERRLAFVCSEMEHLKNEEMQKEQENRSNFSSSSSSSSSPLKVNGSFFNALNESEAFHASFASERASLVASHEYSLHSALELSKRDKDSAIKASQTKLDMEREAFARSLHAKLQAEHVKKMRHMANKHEREIDAIKTESEKVKLKSIEEGIRRGIASSVDSSGSKEKEKESELNALRVKYRQRIRSMVDAWEREKKSIMLVVQQECDVILKKTKRAQAIHDSIAEKRREEVKMIGRRERDRDVEVDYEDAIEYVSADSRDIGINVVYGNDVSVTDTSLDLDLDLDGVDDGEEDRGGKETSMTIEETDIFINSVLNSCR